MAEVRHATPADREAWIGDITALLNRDPATVRCHQELLIEQRDRAVESLGFEVAGQIQEEMMGVDWLTQIQRMTSADPVDMTVGGWDGGWAFALQAHNGYFDRWTVLSMDPEKGQTLLAETPEEWRDFVRTNADLTARLAAHQVLSGSYGRTTRLGSL